MYRDAKELSNQDKPYFNAVFKNNNNRCQNIHAEQHTKSLKKKMQKHAGCHAEPDRHLKPKEKSVLLTDPLFI